VFVVSCIASTRFTSTLLSVNTLATIKNSNRKENDGKKIKRKTKTNDAGLDDGGRI